MACLWPVKTSLKDTKSQTHQNNHRQLPVLSHLPHSFWQIIKAKFKFMLTCQENSDCRLADVQCSSVDLCHDKVQLVSYRVLHRWFRHQPTEAGSGLGSGIWLRTPWWNPASTVNRNFDLGDVIEDIGVDYITVVITASLNDVAPYLHLPAQYTLHQGPSHNWQGHLPNWWPWHQNQCFKDIGWIRIDKLSR